MESLYLLTMFWEMRTCAGNGMGMGAFCVEGVA